MPQIRPITDLRNTNEISDICHAKREPVFITIEAYEEMVERMAMNGAIYDAEMEFALSGETHEARSALKQLRRKHLG